VEEGKQAKNVGDSFVTGWVETDDCLRCPGVDVSHDGDLLVALRGVGLVDGEGIYPESDGLVAAAKLVEAGLQISRDEHRFVVEVKPS